MRCWSDYITNSQLLPEIFFQINFPGAIDADAFRLQARALLVVAGRGTQTDFAARVDDAMPGRLVRAHAHRPANRARRARRAKRTRDLSVRRDLAARNFADEGVDAGEEGTLSFWFQVIFGIRNSKFEILPTLPSMPSAIS